MRAHGNLLGCLVVMITTRPASRAKDRISCLRNLCKLPKNASKLSWKGIQSRDRRVFALPRATSSRAFLTWTTGCPIAELRICRLPPVFVSGQMLATLQSIAEQVEARAKSVRYFAVDGGSNGSKMYYAAQSTSGDFRSTCDG
jgi:hypothetical protein